MGTGVAIYSLKSFNVLISLILRSGSCLLNSVKASIRIFILVYFTLDFLSRSLLKRVSISIEYLIHISFILFANVKLQTILLGKCVISRAMINQSMLIQDFTVFFVFKSKFQEKFKACFVGGRYFCSVTLCKISIE